MRRFKKVLALTLGAALVVSSLSGTGTAQAAAKPKLSKAKLTIKVGKKAALTLKNVKAKQRGKVKWSVSNKKVAGITAKKKNVVTVKGKKAGKTKITAKLGKKKYVCNVTVKAVKKGTTVKPLASATAAVSGGAVSTGAPAATASVSKNDPLLFTTAAPVPPAELQPAYRETPKPVETPVVLSTSKPGSIPDGEQGEAQDPRFPFTLPNVEPGTVIDGGAQPMPTAAPATATPSAVVTLPPMPTGIPVPIPTTGSSVSKGIRVTGTAFMNGEAADYTTLYFYKEGNSDYSYTAYTNGDGDFSLTIYDYAVNVSNGTEYTVKAYAEGWKNLVEIAVFNVFDEDISDLELDEYYFENEVDTARNLTQGGSYYWIPASSPSYFKVTVAEDSFCNLNMEWNEDYDIDNMHLCILDEDGNPWKNITSTDLENETEYSYTDDFEAGTYYLQIRPADVYDDLIGATINISFSQTPNTEE